MGRLYMSDEDYPLEEEGLEDEGEWFLDLEDLEIIVNMDDPPGEAYEQSWMRARDLLESAGPQSAILLLTLTEEENGDLDSKVVLSAGYQRTPSSLILEVLDAHLAALEGE